MADIRPFRALRPTAELASAVASPPYDVVNSDEARAIAEGNPHSFLHVVKPEIDLPKGTNLYSDEVYARGKQNLNSMIEAGTFVRDERPHYYVYRQTMGEHTQVGLVAGASVAEYDNNRIMKHEKTRQTKEDDRTRHVDTLNAQTGPVFLTYKSVPAINALIARVTAHKPDNDFVAPDGIAHTFWVVRDGDTAEGIHKAFSKVETLYIADGHHRSASASRVAKLRRQALSAPTGHEPFEHFMSVIFPDDQMMVLDYNRVVLDLNGLSAKELVERVSEKFDVTPGNADKPAKATEFRMYVAGDWFTLNAKSGSFDAADPVACLDVSILQDNLLNPILAVGDPRTDERIDFVGGIRGTAELKRRVDEGGGAAFALFPTSMTQLMAIADAGSIMPPKSTWFEPKLRSGLVVKLLED